MLCRSVSRYRFYDLRSIPVQEQFSALRGQLAAWQPFPEARYWVQWAGGCASVHACAAEGLLELSPRTTVLPEVCLRAPLQDGLRLLQCIEGFEGQFWADGRLRASQWWPALPEPVDWISFVRASGHAPVPMPAAEAPPWGLPDLRVQALERLGAVALAPLRMVGVATLAALLGFSAYVAHAYQEARQSAHEADAELQAVRAKAQPIGQARDSAQKAVAELQAVIKPLLAPQPIEVLDHLARQLPKTVLLREFDLQGQEVRVLLDTPPDLPRSQLFEALEAGEWFTKVTEQNGARTGIALQFRLNGIRPPSVLQQAATGVGKRSTDVAKPSPTQPAPVMPTGAPK